MSVLPYDIWCRIIQLLPPDSQRNCYFLNRAFFAFGMKARYQSVTFTKSDREMKRLGKHLSDPGIRDLVRSVTIKPWLVQPRTKSYQSISENIWNYCNILLDPDYIQNQAEKRFQKRLQKDINRVTDAVVGLTRVKEYTLDWDEHRSYHTELYRAFSTNLLTKCSWMNTLEKLTIKIPSEMLFSMTHISLPNLKHFEVHISTGDLPTSDIHHIFDGFLVFVHNLKDSLQSISITTTSSSKNMDLSYFFKHLGTFPHLRKFLLSIPFEGSHFPQVSDLQRFLNRHKPTLQELVLRTSRCAVTEHTCTNWIRTIIGDIKEPFPELRSVEMALRPVQADLKPLIGFLCTHVDVLKSLTLTDRVLTSDKIQEMLTSLGFSSHLLSLQELRIKVRCLSPQLLTMLAVGLPQLRTLGLSFDEIASNEMCHNKNDLDKFCNELKQDKEIFSRWLLRTVIVPQGPPQCQWLGNLERVLVECIPSLACVQEMPRPGIT